MQSSYLFPLSKIKNLTSNIILENKFNVANILTKINDLELSQEILDTNFKSYTLR